MKKINDEVADFIYNQGCVIVSTIDKNGFVHNSCKGIFKINRNGRIFILDLYMGKTYENLKRNQHLSITAIDEHEFTGYCLKGKAILKPKEKLYPKILKLWEDYITSRLARRLLKNIREEKGNNKHPEILLPQPQYLIIMEVEEVVDMTPHHLK